jgi:hypothetical protein
VNIFICKHCNKEYSSINASKNHELRCSNNPGRLLNKISKQPSKPIKIEENESVKCSYGCGKTASFIMNNGKYLCADNKSKCEEIKSRIRSNQKNLQPNPIDPVKMEEKRRKVSENMKLRYASGWEPVCGRSKKYNYESPAAGKIKVDGTWELKVAKYLDSLGVDWIRNKKRFDYIKPNGSKSTYQPDFYVKDWDTFLEIKGYETELDRAKWKQFPEKLQVWYREKINKLEG